MMTGLAKSFFIESYQRSPWKISERQPGLPTWPLFEAFLAKQRLSYLDYILTRKLLRHHPHIGQEVAFFICHLILAAKGGHLCVRIDQSSLLPTHEQLWQQEGTNSLSSIELQLLKELIMTGLQQVPSSLITNITISANEEFPLTPLCRYHNLFYLQRHWVFESIFFRHFKRLFSDSPNLQLDMNQIQTELLFLCQQGVLLDEQVQAIIRGCTYSVSFITGGPGTGKTYTAGYFIKIFWQSLSLAQRLDCKIVLTAPTGKAAANLQKSLSNVMAGIDGFPSVISKTLHALLGIKGSQASLQDKPRLDADLILVDESSMIDIKIMASLFEAVKEGARLILLGDPHQLPSVEAGSVFADLIRLYSKQEDYTVPCCTQLRVCLRADLRSIVEFAKTINQGNADKALKMFQDKLEGIKHFILPNDWKVACQIFLRQIGPYFPSIIKKGMAPNHLLNLFNTIRLLSPMRKGPFGVNALNQLLWTHVSQKQHVVGWLAVPIIIVTNDYQQDLFNGETGVLMRRLPLRGLNGANLHLDDYALFPSRENENNVRRIHAVLLPKYEYAYCLSVHKSQGSEFDRVILVMPEGSELFGREVFYTAVTRARKQLEVYASELVICKTIAQQGVRLSGIDQRFDE